MSNQDDEKFEVALTKCFYCGEANETILSKRLSKPIAKQVKEMDGKVVSMTPCTKCEGYMKQGVILITIDPAKSDPNWYDPGKGKMPNPFRSGGFFVVRDRAVKEMLADEPELVEWAIKYRWMFIEHEAAAMVGLFGIADKGGDENAP